jgi:TPP-dependent pyruvate/acetoin dehydrogenase alpha subunit
MERWLVAAGAMDPSALDRVRATVAATVDSAYTRPLSDAYPAGESAFQHMFA